MRVAILLIASLVQLSSFNDVHSEFVSEESWGDSLIGNGIPTSQAEMFVILEFHNHASFERTADGSQRFRQNVTREIESLYRHHGYMVNFVISSDETVHLHASGTPGVRVLATLRVPFERRTEGRLYEILESVVLSGKLGRFSLYPLIRMSLKPSTDSQLCSDPNTEFSCGGEAETECHDLQRLCDGTPQCTNGVDERNCRSISPLVKVFTIPSKSLHTVGENLTIHCAVARSYTDVRFQWILPATKALDSVHVTKASRHSTLTTTISSTEDAGIYRCKVTNQHGSSIIPTSIRVGQASPSAHPRAETRNGRNSVDLVIKVNGATVRSSSYYLSLRQSVSITCDVLSQPENGRMQLVIPESSRRTVESSDSQVSLSIDNVRESDLGTYSCLVFDDDTIVAVQRLTLKDENRRVAQMPSRSVSRPKLTRSGTFRSTWVAETCKDNQFQCKNGRCIDSKWRCDGRNDCDDESDEIPCPKLQRADFNQFTCGNGRFIPRNWVCDGDFDCNDRSDEVNCSVSTASCVYQCDSKCVSRGRICDYETQVIMMERGCVAKIDELECSLPQIQEIKPESAQVPYQESILLTCRAGGYPPPSIAWSRDNGYLPSRLRASERFEFQFNLQDRRQSYSMGYLTINPARPEDNGEYRCVATNSRGSVTSAPVTLSVEACSSRCSGGTSYNSVAGSTSDCLECYCSSRSTTCTSSLYGTKWESIAVSSSMTPYVSQRSTSGYYYPRKFRNSGAVVYPQALVRFPQPDRSGNAETQIVDDALWINSTEFSEFGLLKVADLPQLFPDLLHSYGAVFEYEFFVSVPYASDSLEDVVLTSEFDIQRKIDHKLINGEYYQDEAEPRRTYRFGDLTLSYANYPPHDFYINRTLRANRWNKIAFTFWEREPIQAYHEMIESSDHFVEDTHAIWLSQDDQSSKRLNQSLRQCYLTDLDQLKSVFVRAKYHPNQVAFGVRNIRVLKPDTETVSDKCRDTQAWKIENCTCPTGYQGLSCDKCAPGYNRVYNEKTKLQECTQCSCNNHSTSCDANTGQCFNCWHNTDGKQCDQCAVGYYRNKNVPITSPDACVPCNCGYLNKNQEDKFIVPCSVNDANEVVCHRCPYWMEGGQCGTCDSTNVAEGGTCYNAADKCSSFSKSSEDLCCRCLNYTTGVKCQYCKPGYFGYELMQTERRLFGECTKCYCFNRSSTCLDQKDTLYWQKFSWDAPSQCNEDTHYRHWRYVLMRANHSWNETIDWRTVPSSNLLSSYSSNNYVDLVIAEQPDEKMVAPNNWTKFLSGGLAPAYCLVPRCWLGDFVTSYGGNLTTKVFYQANRPWKSPFKRFPHFVIQGSQGIQLAHYSPQEMPSNAYYSVRLLEPYWSIVEPNGVRRPTRVEFLQVLSQVKDIYIKCLHRVNKDQNLPVASGLLSYAHEYASTAVSDQRALTVEQCYCPTGYAGTSCEKCADGYYAKKPEAGEVCKLCTCNGRADRCSPDGECIGCRDNSGGKFCERCADGYWGNPNSPEGCKPCKCYGTYGYPLKCTTTPDGMNYTCECPPSATGPRCEECSPGYNREDLMDLTAPCNKPGAQRCGCSRDGTLPGQRWTCKIPACTGGSPQCACKPLAVGYKCDRCVNESYINLDWRNPEGCDLCYCSGRSNVCNASSALRNYGLSEVLPRYSDMKPTVDCESSQIGTCEQNIQFSLVSFSADGTSVSSAGSIRLIKDDEVTGDVSGTTQYAYWQLPKDFNDAGVGMYSLSLTYSIEFNKLPLSAPAASLIPDVFIKAGGRQIVYTYPSPPQVVGTRYDYTVTIDEKNFDKYNVVDPQWYQKTEAELTDVQRVQQSRVDVLKVLSYASGIYIRASYMPNEPSTSIIRNVRLQIVEHSENARLPTGSKAVEICPCPTGYQGFSCEKCAPGYKYAPSVREEYPRTCVPCMCHNHSQSCNPETGECVDCLHNTEGYNCEGCQPGYIRPVLDPFHRCQPCLCPGMKEEGKHFAAGGCNVDPVDQTKYRCVCDEGYAGDHCEKCADGYDGKPRDGVPCTKISVSIDYNYIFAALMSTKSFTCLVSPATAELTQPMTWARMTGGSIDSAKTVIDAATNTTYTQVTFSEIDPRLAGSYNCCAYQNSWSECKTGQLNVSDPPTLKATLTPNVTRCVLEQEDVEFLCKSQPDLSYLHYDFESELLNYTNVQVVNKNRIVVANANRTQNLSAVCSIHPSWIAEQGESAVSNTVEMCVTVPYVQLTITPSNPIEEDSDVYLECRLHPYGIAQARRPLDIINIHTLEKERDTVVVRNTSYILVLFPRATKAMYDGSYRCLAEYGNYVPTLLRDDGLVDITQGIPVLRLDIPPWRIEGQTLDMQCVLEGALAKFFTFSIYRYNENGEPQLLAEADAHTIENVQTSDSGSYFCKVIRVDDVNDEGVDSPRNNTAVYIPHVNIAPPERVINPGKSGMFECAFKPHFITSDGPLVFGRVDGQALRSKSFVFTNSSYGNLTITDANGFDATNYLCSATWNGRTFVGYTQLSLAVPTDFRVVISVTDRNPVYGQKLSFTCSTSPQMDQDDTVYSFQFNNQDVLPPGTRVALDKILIDNAQPSIHNGAYGCCAVIEGLAPHCSDLLFISVAAEPPSVSVRPVIAIKALNQSATFACIYRGVPTPAAQWVSITAERRPVYDDTTKQLILTQVSLSNIGQYQCNASNAMGSASASAWLFAYDIKEANKSYEKLPVVASGAPDSTLTLTCYTGPEKSATLWRYNGKEISQNDPNYLIDHDLSTLTIKNLNETLAGEYTCIAVDTNARIVAGKNSFVAAFRHAASTEKRVITGVVGLGFTLSCPASQSLVNKTHIVRWFRFDKRGNRVSVTNETPGLRIVRNEVVFQKLAHDDSAIYICEATSVIAQESYELHFTTSNLLPAFRIDSLIAFPSAARYEIFERMTIELAFLYQGDGLIVYNDNEPRSSDSFAIGVNNGHVEITMNFGETQSHKLRSGVTIQARNWSHVIVERYRGNISLTVQGSRDELIVPLTDYVALDVGGLLYFGAPAEALSRSGYDSSFQGAIGLFSINGRSLRFGQEYLLIQNVVHHNECAVGQPTCRGETGSFCVSDYSPRGYRCVCPENYGGNNCEHIGAKCSRDRCGVFGVCSSKKLPNEETEQNVLCTCPLGVLGRHCEIGVPVLSPVFVSQSYIEYAAALPNREKELTIDVLFLPLERDDAATVFYQASGLSYFALIIADGNLEFLFVESPGSYLSIAGPPITQTETLVRVIITPQKLQLAINGQVISAIPNTKPGLLDRISGSFVLGYADNAPDDPLLPREGFEGEITQIRINELPLDLAYPIISSRNLTDGSRMSKCHPTACNNHGQCLPSGACECNRQYDPATNCSTKTDESVCDVLPQCECYNGGICEQSGDWFTCSCPPGFKGDRCEVLSVAYSAHIKDAYLILPPQYNAKQLDRETFEFTFKYDKPATKVVNGMLAVYGDPSETGYFAYFGLLVVRGKVQLHIGYRFGPGVKFEFTSKTAKGHTFKEKYTVKLERVGRKINITENGVSLYSQDMVFEDEVNPTSALELTVTRGWYLVGMPELKGDKAVNDIGFDASLPSCISDFTVDGELVDFMPLKGSEIQSAPGGSLTLNCNLPA